MKRSDLSPITRAVCLAVALAGCGATASTVTVTAPAASKTITVTTPSTAGTGSTATAATTLPESNKVAGLLVFDGGTWTGPAGALCSTYGESAAADVQPGAQVTVKNANGSVIGAGALGKGGQVLASGTTYFCGYHFSVSQLPKSDFYQFSLGSRPPVTYSYAQMQASGWRARLSVN